MRAQNPLSARQPACEHRRVLCGRSFVVFQSFKCLLIKCKFSCKQLFSLSNCVFSPKVNKVYQVFIFFLMSLSKCKMSVIKAKPAILRQIIIPPRFIVVLFSKTSYLQGSLSYLFSKTSYLQGSLSYLFGWTSYLQGSLSYLFGWTSYLQGSFSYLFGWTSYLRGSLLYLLSRISYLQS